MLKGVNRGRCQTSQPKNDVDEDEKPALTKRKTFKQELVESKEE